MFTATTQQMLSTWKGMQEMTHGTIVPAALLLLMALDNGWEIERASALPSTDPKAEPAYFVSLRSCADGRRQNLVVPGSSLVDKILEQNAPRFVH